MVQLLQPIMCEERERCSYEMAIPSSRNIMTMSGALDNDAKHCEFLSREVMQCGLSWLTI
ncbi:MAG: hypothetical protein AB7D92_04760 [Sphaerochaeta sp.]